MGNGSYATDVSAGRLERSSHSSVHNHSGHQQHHNLSNHYQQYSSTHQHVRYSPTYQEYNPSPPTMIHQSCTQISSSIMCAPSYPDYHPNDAYYNSFPQQQFYKPIVHQQAYLHIQHLHQPTIPHQAHTYAQQYYPVSIIPTLLMPILISINNMLVNLCTIMIQTGNIIIILLVVVSLTNVICKQHGLLLLYKPSYNYIVDTLVTCNYL